MRIEIDVVRRVIDGDEFGPAEYVLTTDHPDGAHTLSEQNEDPGEAFKGLLTAYLLEKASL